MILKSCSWSEGKLGSRRVALDGEASSRTGLEGEQQHDLGASKAGADQARIIGSTIRCGRLTCDQSHDVVRTDPRHRARRHGQ